MPSKINYGMDSDLDVVVSGKFHGTGEKAKYGSQTSLSSKASSLPDPSEAIPTDPREIEKEKRKILKNVFIISLCFLFNFTAYNGLARLQSSLHREEGMGTVNQAVLYGALVLSCLFVPKLLISAIGHKWTIPLSFTGYLLWMAANGYAVWGTMVTASILTGLCAAPLWTAQCSYFTKIAGRYAKLTKEPEEAVVSRFFGIFFMFFQLSSIFGSIISLTVLMPEGDPEADNATLTDEEITLYCGLNDCPDNNITNPNEAQPDDKTVWIMVGAYLGAGALAILIASLAVDQLPRYMRDDPGQAKAEVKQNAINTVMNLRHLSQCLLIPITMYSGFEQAFYGAEWNASFITCSLGIWKVGLVTLPFGAVNAVVSMTTGYLIKYIGRVPMFTLGLIVDLSIQTTLIVWPLDKSKEYVFYIISALWGLTDGIWQTQINALYGSIFAKESEAAFSNYRMWESFGFIIAFSYSSFLCTSVKLYVLMSVLLLGTLLYYVVEVLEGKKKKRRQEEDRNMTTPKAHDTPALTDRHHGNTNFTMVGKSSTWPEIGETYGYQNGDFTHM